MSTLIRRAHFLGSKVRSLRKRLRMTLEDLSVRCLAVDPRLGPSVSYLSMIETGKRVPSEGLVALLGEVLQREPAWFLDDDAGDAVAEEGNRPGSPVRGIELEPHVLFSRDQLSTAIPELLGQTGTSGRQFAQLLIRTYQENRGNSFPDLERAAEEVGERRFPLSVADLLSLAEKVGLEIVWFDREPFATTEDDSGGQLTIVRSFFEAPGRVYLNRVLEAAPGRLKYDIASHIGHQVLHGGDGNRSVHTSGGWGGASPLAGSAIGGVDADEVLFAWRDFECGFFADALLCPRQPFRQYLLRSGHQAQAGVARFEITASVMMRRMTTVSPYPHWHYLDAYPPGRLRHVYRGNGIPLPWGNMRMVLDPCQQWAVFRRLNESEQALTSQISVLPDGTGTRLYACQTRRSRDAAGNLHTICVGVDLAPALATQGFDPTETTEAIEQSCRKTGGEAPVPADALAHIASIAKVLSIEWIASGLDAPANIICPRSSACPRRPACGSTPARQARPHLESIREEILRQCG